MAAVGSAKRTYPFCSSDKMRKKSYAVRLAAQFGDTKAKSKLYAYNQRVKERKMQADEKNWMLMEKPCDRYTVMDYIVSQVANGTLLSDVCSGDEMPSVLQVYSWFDNHPAFKNAMDRAELVRGHRLGDEVERIARATDRENVAADKLKTDVLGKAAARLNPKFQDKVVQEVKDPYAHMTTDQVREQIRRMLQADPSLVDSVPEFLAMSQAEPIDVLPLPPSALPSLSHAQSETPGEAAD